MNWRLHGDLDLEIENRYNYKLLNTGSCGLHILHNGFKSAVKDMAIDNFLISCHRLFYESPARREDYVEFSGGCDVFPLQFCSQSWLENVDVAERCIELIEPLSKYLKSVQAGKCPNPKTKSFEVVREWVSDSMCICKLSFF